MKSSKRLRNFISAPYLRTLFKRKNEPSLGAVIGQKEVGVAVVEDGEASPRRQGMGIVVHDDVLQHERTKKSLPVL